MENRTKDINEIIIRYLDGSATSDDRQNLLLWLKESDKNLNEFMEIKELWLSCNMCLTGESETNWAWLRLLSRIDNRQESGADRQAMSGRDSVADKSAMFRKGIRKWMQAAAIALVLLGTGWWIANRNTAQSSEKEVVVRNQLITAKGSKGRFVLPDSSIVWLNSDSKLSYNETFDGKQRLVHLEGEGYFEVAKDIRRPFIVQTGHLTVEAIGTAFDISDYDFWENNHVVLLNGSVQITSSALAGKTALSPDQIFTYEVGGKAEVRKTNARLHVEWIKNRLIFDNDRLTDILICLEGWYNVKFVCPEAFARKTRISFTVRDETINEILKALSLVVPVHYAIEENTVKITPKKIK